MTVVDLLGMGSQGREARPDPLGAKPSEGTVPSAAQPQSAGLGRVC